jgi:hypothetical protein
MQKCPFSPSSSAIAADPPDCRAFAPVTQARSAFSTGCKGWGETRQISDNFHLYQHIMRKQRASCETGHHPATTLIAAFSPICRGRRGAHRPRQNLWLHRLACTAKDGHAMHHAMHSVCLVAVSLTITPEEAENLASQTNDGGGFRQARDKRAPTETHSVGVAHHRN